LKLNDYQFFEQLVYNIIKYYEGITLEDLVITLVEFQQIIEEERLLIIIDTMKAKKLIIYQKDEEGFIQLFVNTWEDGLLYNIF